MAEMRYVQDPVVDRKVAEIVEELRNELIAEFDPKSIILCGSFGKGEVAVTLNDDGIGFLSDCEVLMIPGTSLIDRGRTHRFCRDFHERHGLNVDLCGTIMGIYLTFPHLNKRLKPSIENYDLRNGSEVIHGWDYMKRIPAFGPGEIRPWEGVRLVFNRMMEAMEHLALKGPCPETVFWTDKIVLACQDGMLLSRGLYHHKYAERNRMLEEMLSKDDAVLKTAEGLIEPARRATERRLKGSGGMPDPLEYWFEVRGVCDPVFRHIMRESMGLEYGDYMEFQERYISNREITRNSRYLSSHPWGQNIELFMKMLVVSRRLPPRALVRAPGTPCSHLIYSLIPLMYFGLEGMDRVNMSYIDRVLDILMVPREEGAKKDYGMGDYHSLVKEVSSIWHDTR